jgi:putative heme-binding domain-containing protein
MRFIRCLAIIFIAALAGDSSAQQNSRPPWTTSRITGAPEPPRPYIAEQIFPSLKFDQPLELVAVPGTNRLVILELGGKIYSFPDRPEDASVETDLFADVRPRDPEFASLYGLAFHPKFAENRYCYVSYVLKGKLPDGSRVSRFKVTASDPPRLVPESEEIVIRWLGGGHNGANLQFGPDGYLYISTGDGGDSFPPDGRNTGQNLSDLEASILRIDVDHRDGERPYRIPPDNPFVDRPGARGEVWAYGVRNPWKMCFDPADGSLWVGDVGWEMWELIYRIERGANYGWSIVEGPQPVQQERERGPTPIVPPTVAHSHIEARSITGGYFSQTSRLPELRGAYIYGDYVTGKVWGLRHEGSQVTWREELVDTPLQIVSFGLNHAGDVLIVDYPSGTLHRLAPNPRRGANENFPRKLSETGLFADTAKQIPATGVVPYSVNAAPWADGATAQRYVGLPEDAKLGTYTKTNSQIGFIAGDWSFPDGGVLAKTVSLELEPGNPASRRRLETQILHYDVDTWKAYNYLWNDEQTDAVLADDVGSDRQLHVKDATAPGGQRRQTWHHASRTECLLCHTTRVSTILGFKQQNLVELSSLDQIGLFTDRLKKNVVRWPNPHDETAALDGRARAYLHINCGHCHSRGGGGSSFFDVRFDLPLAKTSLIGSRPTQGTFGILGAEIIAPGDPYRSVLYYRMSKLGHGRMPQFGSRVVDSHGTKLLRNWIESLNGGTVPKGIMLLRIEETKQLLELLDAFTKKPRDEAAVTHTMASLLSSPSGALMLVDGLTPDRATQLRQRLIETGYVHPDPAIRDLFEQFIPEEQRVKRLGDSIKPEEILALKGDAARGRDLFFNSAGLQCKKCHKIGDQGQSLGPDLSQIGKKLDKPKLLESILEPSKTIDPQFVSYLVETASGEVVSGLLVRRSDAEIVLKTADGKEVAFSKAEVERSSPQQKSLMPELMLRDLTREQAADLLEFLAGLK